MKNWKKYMAVLAALLLVLSFVACGPEETPSEPPAEQTDAPATEAPTTEAPTEIPTVAPTVAEEEYSTFKGIWYSDAVALNIQEETKWSLSEGDKLVMSGYLAVDENGDLMLYDGEGLPAVKLTQMQEGGLYAEVLADNLFAYISDYNFTREASENMEVEEIVDVGIVGDQTEEQAPEVPEE